jgi:alpha-ribazole phosphatase
MVKTLYLIRHGATQGDGVKRYKGSLDVPLSEEGIEQIKRVALYLSKVIKDERPVVYSSPLSRALKSAEIISDNFNVKPVIVPELRERNFGIWEGMSFEQIKERYPEEFSLWADNPLKYSPPGGESTIEVRDRVMKALRGLLHPFTNSPIQIIVAHGGVNRIILCEFLGIPLENIFRIEQEHGAINIIEFHDNYPVVKLVNGICTV